MTLTFAQDYSSSVVLDSQLTGVSDSGLFWNKGSHPLITLRNVLDFAPNLDFTFSSYSAGTTYSKYDTTQSASDIVTYNSVLYQSLTNSNTGNTPDSSPSNWLETNIESLRIKSLIETSRLNLISSTKLSRRLIESQLIYNISDVDTTLPEDYCGWAFEPKGSDYVKIRINEIAFTANTDTQQSLYVINQNELIDTLTLNPQDGKLVYEELDYTISGKGVFYFVVDSQSVKSSGAYNDPLKYRGFVCYPVIGSGGSAEAANYSRSFNGNGLNWNISCYLDSTSYIDNNIVDFARLWQLQFAYDMIQNMMYNSNVRSNNTERNANSQLIQVESFDLKSSTIAKEYHKELKEVKDSINRTFDRFLKSPKGLKIKRGTL